MQGSSSEKSTQMTVRESLRSNWASVKSRISLKGLRRRPSKPRSDSNTIQSGQAGLKSNAEKFGDGQDAVTNDANGHEGTTKQFESGKEGEITEQQFENGREGENKAYHFGNGEENDVLDEEQLHGNGVVNNDGLQLDDETEENDARKNEKRKEEGGCEATHGAYENEDANTALHHSRYSASESKEQLAKAASKPDHQSATGCEDHNEGARCEYGETQHTEVLPKQEGSAERGKTIRRNRRASSYVLSRSQTRDESFARNSRNIARSDENPRNDTVRQSTTRRQQQQHSTGNPQKRNSIVSKQSQSDKVKSENRSRKGNGQPWTNVKCAYNVTFKGSPYETEQATSKEYEEWERKRQADLLFWRLDMEDIMLRLRRINKVLDAHLRRLSENEKCG